MIWLYWDIERAYKQFKHQEPAYGKQAKTRRRQARSWGRKRYHRSQRERHYRQAIKAGLYREV